MNEEEALYLQQVERAYQQEVSKNFNSAQGSIFSIPGQENLIQWQLDLREELERIEHLLRGHTLKYDEKGNFNWAETTDDNLKPFNEYGVRLLMNIISFYLNRNTILSYYDEEMINWKMMDLGEDLSDLIFMKYDEMGMNTPQKRKLFPIIVRQIIDTIHSAYLRALEGGERDSLRTARHVTQNDPGIQQPNYQAIQPQQRRFSLFKPSTWGR